MVPTDGWRAATQVFEKRQVGSIRQIFADLVWLASESCRTTHVGDIVAVNLKTLDFSPLSEFLLATGGPHPMKAFHRQVRAASSRNDCPDRAVA